MRAYKEETFAVVVGNSYLFQDVIKKDHHVILTTQSKVARSKLPRFDHLDVKSIVGQLSDNGPHSSNGCSGRIVQVRFLSIAIHRKLSVKA